MRASTIIIGIGLSGVLAGCSSSPVGMELPGGNDPTAQAGFAQSGDVLSGSTITDTLRLAELVFLDSGGTEINTGTTQVSVAPGPTDGTILVDYGDGQVVLTEDSGNPGNYFGNSSDFDYELFVFGVTSIGQANFGYLYRGDYDTGGDEGLFGYFASGLNSDPTVVDERLGTVLYDGTVSVAITDGNGNGRWAGGDSVFTVEFDSNAVSGEFNINNNFGSYGPDGREEVPETTILIDPTSIDGNAFETQLTIEDGGLALDGLDSSIVSGQFFEAEATALGGTFTASGTDNDGALNIVVQGAFLAETTN